MLESRVFIVSTCKLKQHQTSVCPSDAEAGFQSYTTGPGEVSLVVNNSNCLNC